MPTPVDITLTPTVVSAYEIDLSWTDSAGTAVHYQVTRNGVVIATLPLSTTTYNDTVLAPSSTYTYVVNGLNSGGSVIYTSNAPTPTTNNATCDAYFANTSLLLHCDGANGSTSFVDSSINNYTVASSAMAVSTANPKYGSGAALASSTTSQLTVPNSPNGPLDLSLGDFTIEFWIYITANSPQVYFGQGTAANPIASMQCYNTSGRNVQTEIQAFNGTIATTPNNNSNLNSNAWNHVALTRQGTTFTVWINGTSISNTTYSGQLYQPSDGVFAIGFIAPGHGSTYAGVQYDDIRITKGVSRYNANFTPPPAAMPGSCFAIVPNVTGLPLATAEANLTAANLTTGTITTQFSLTVPGGYIISQNPIAGTTVASSSGVNLVESDGPGTGTVPNVINLSQALAEAAIEAAGFTVGAVTTQADTIIIAGNVDVQAPAGGTTAFLLSPVNITVSTGNATILIPDIIGLTQVEAEAAITVLGLVVGAIGVAPSDLVESGLVMLQNPSAGQVAVPGQIVSFVLSSGEPVPDTLFDVEATVISQFANSPTLLQLVNNMNQYIDQSANFAAFIAYVWNVETAQGFGLDILGKIVDVGRLLNISTTNDYVGFYISSESQPDQDWQPMGSDQPPQPAVGGAMYTGYNATTAYLLPDNAYRQLILAKAFANICATTAPAINQILQNLYGAGSAWVLNTGVMSISYNLNFQPSAIQLAILEQSGVIPTPPGVSVTVNANV